MVQGICLAEKLGRCYVRGPGLPSVFREQALDEVLVRHVIKCLECVEAHDRPNVLGVLEVADGAQEVFLLLEAGSQDEGPASRSPLHNPLQSGR